MEETNEQVKTTEETKVEETEKKPELKYSDDDVNRIVQERLAREQKKREKEVAEAEKLAKMNEQEKSEYKIAELEKELKELKAEKNRSEMLNTARDIFEKEHVSVGAGILNALVKEDAESTNKAVKEFVELFKAEVDKGVKATVSGSTPRKGGSSALTKEEIMAIKDPNKRHKAIEENMELWKKG